MTAIDMHQFAARGVVDPSAPARATGQIGIATSPEKVWDALAKVQNWPSFRADVTQAETDGTGRFTWRADGLPVESRFAIVERPTRLTWSNSAPGLSASCVYEFHRTDDGHTVVRCEESMDASAIAPHIDDAVLAEGIRTWLEGIKSFVEGQALNTQW